MVTILTQHLLMKTEYSIEVKKKKSIDFSQPYANEVLKVLHQSPGSRRNYDTNLGLSRVSTLLLGSFFCAFRPSLDAQ